MSDDDLRLLAVQTTKSVQGNVDGADNGRIRGWAFDPHQATKRIRIGIYLGEQCLFTFEADRMRQDLLELGFGDGRHGFDVAIPVELFATPLLTFQVCHMDSGSELTGSPIVMRAPRIQINETSLAMLGNSIAAMSSAATSAASLDGLRAWLGRHRDLVYARQTNLIRSAVHRDLWFTDHLARKGTLTSVLQDAARAAVAQYDTLHLEPVDDPQVSVIIPAFNHFDYTHRCVSSIIEHIPSARLEVIVVDDGSTDETLYAALVLFGGIRLIRIPRNGGFMDAVSAGIRQARGRYLLLLNNDTEVCDGWLDELLQTFMRDPAIGIAGSKLIYPNGQLQEAGGLVWRQGTAMNWGRQENPDDPRYCFMRDTDYVSGAALMIERSLFDAVGGLSAEFAPAYYEDTDLCFKVRAAGRRVVVQPRSRVIHHEGVTSGSDFDGVRAKRFQRLNHRTFLMKWFETLQLHSTSDADPRTEIERWVTKRALFIDDTVPTPDKDAGSNAATQYMLSLQRLGFKVSFIGADNVAKISPYTEDLESRGIQCHYRPYCQSVEALISDSTVAYDLFFIHRPLNMEKYAPLIRQVSPNAMIVYCVADLHHVRLAREADIKRDKALRREAKTMKAIELAMIAAADSVIVHSTFEAKHVADIVPTADVHVIPWPVAGRPPVDAFEARKGLLFVGGFNHTPNVDAAIWLVREIMPLVWAQDPTIECQLVGSQMPPEVHALRQTRVHIAGHLPDLQPALDRVRLTVAPLRYGAGLKGKVLTSLAAGLPCVATSCATEGMNLPDTLNVLVAETPEGLATRILLAHRDETLNAKLSKAGVDYIAAMCSQDRVDTLLRAATTRQEAANPLDTNPEQHREETPGAGKKRRKPTPKRSASETGLSVPG